MSYRFKRNTLALIVGLTLGAACTYAQASNDGPCTKNCGPTTPTPVVGPITVSPPITVAPITTVTPVIAPVTHINPVTVVAPTITSENHNAQSQSQGQQQSQGQNQGQSQQAYGGAGGNGGEGGVGYGSAASSASASGGALVNSGNTANSGNNTGTANVVVEGDQAQARNPVASALAPTVYTGTDQCLVPVSLGGQAVGFGLSFGVAVRDEICEVLKLSRQLEYLTDKATALNFLRMHDKRVDAALTAAGK